ncbi:MAG TPA: hypothetical protein DCW68_02100 [Rhodospirillaceae bacterium]|nr:MAG: hypothetical protein A2018_05065 [Alphaproteobacteria bacterium GWF2_58_20]HAU28887.1 hypothetical protein [Rhodospirillaceae bacterium]
MKRFLASASLAILMASQAQASSFEDALASAWQTNPQMESARAALRGTAESLPQAISGWLPSLDFSASAGVSRSDSHPGARDSSESRSIGLTLSQPIYNGGGTMSAIRSAKETIRSGIATFSDSEQTFLLSAITAYVDAIRSAAILKATANNEEVLKRQLEATTDRFDVGELTRTDVSQAKASFASVTASRIKAEGDLNSAIATYESILGSKPNCLPIADGSDIPLPPLPMGMPVSLESTIEEALMANPAMITSSASLAIAEEAANAIKAAMRPSLALSANLGKAWSPSSATTKDTETASVTARFSVPIYAGGYDDSRLRQAKQSIQQSSMALENTKRTIRQSAISTWESWTSTHAAIEAYKAAVTASDLALEGVRSENEVGTRTILDILNAEQDSLDAHVNLINARRDELISAYGLLAVVGRLTARDLALDVPYFNAPEEAQKVSSHWGW